MSRNPRIRIWTAPILLGFIAAIGLITALISDGFGDYLSWSALAIPLAVVAWYAPRRFSQQRGAQTSTAVDEP